MLSPFTSGGGMNMDEAVATHLQGKSDEYKIGFMMTYGEVRDLTNLMEMVGGGVAIFKTVKGAAGILRNGKKVAGKADDILKQMENGGKTTGPGGGSPRIVTDYAGSGKQIRLSGVEADEYAKATRPVYKPGSVVELDYNGIGNNGVKLVRKMEANPNLTNQRKFNLPENSGLVLKESRIVDLYDIRTGRAIEVKNSLKNKIGIKSDIRKQIDADVFLRTKNPDKYKPEWHFLKPPTDELMQLLEVNKIPYTIYGR